MILVLFTAFVLISSGIGIFLVGSCLWDLFRLESPSALRQVLIMLAGTMFWLTCGSQPFLCNGLAGFNILSGFGTAGLVVLLVEYMRSRYWLWKCSR